MALQLIQKQIGHYIIIVPAVFRHGARIASIGFFFAFQTIMFNIIDNFKQADAVMFVMNPTPLEDIEVDFLKEIVSVTPGILFVTTKIDQNGNESVEKSLNRNHQIIEKAVGNDLPFGISMLKMSSKLLLEAAIGNDEITSEFNYEISGYDDVKSAMNNMVFTILGYYRSGLAYNACVEYYREVLNALKLRHETAVKAATEYEQECLFDWLEDSGKSQEKQPRCRIYDWRRQGSHEYLTVHEGSRPMRFDFVIGKICSGLMCSTLSSREYIGWGSQNRIRIAC